MAVFLSEAAAVLASVAALAAVSSLVEAVATVVAHAVLLAENLLAVVMAVERAIRSPVLPSINSTTFKILPFLCLFTAN